MTVRRGRLRKADVDRLLAEPTPDVRIETMVKLVQDLEEDCLVGRERAMALEILEMFATDAAVAVREAVSRQIFNSPLLTAEMAETLAADVAQVAFPILRHAERVEDALLLKVLREGEAAKHLAIAGRSSLSPPVAEALAGAGGLAAVVALIRNETVHLNGRALTSAFDRFGRLQAMQEAMAVRPELPMAVIERLVAVSSLAVRGHLMRRHGLAAPVVEALVRKGREAATLRLLKPLVKGREEARSTARWLLANDRITVSLLFRTLCAGDFDLFDFCLALRAGVNPDNVRTVAWDAGALGLKALFRRARWPAATLPVFAAAITVARTSGYRGGDDGRDTFQSEAVARIFETCLPTSAWEVDDLLMQVFDQMSDTATDRALARSGMPFSPLRG